MLSTHNRLNQAVTFLRQLISIPSPSDKEDEVAALWIKWLTDNGVEKIHRIHNNVLAIAPGFRADRPTLLLNSHMDTVIPAASYTRSPYSADIEGDRLYGLGSNDASASGVTLACTFLELMKDAEPPVNLMLGISAMEERMGPRGMRAFLPFMEELGYKPDMAIIGEPTGMQPAIAERGLLVLDGTVTGVSGHAARSEGVNAIYRAMEDINSLITFSPERVSSILGPIGVNVTMINAGTQHNVVPDRCTYVADVRTTDAYTNTETVELLRQAVKWSTLTPRSTHINASAISLEHPLTRSAIALGLEPYVSPTVSDRALLTGIPALKIGPGQSSRSHSADEYVLISEINNALDIYPRLIRGISL